MAVLYLGQIVELGTRRQIFESPQHAYTRKLLAAVPVAEPPPHRHLADRRRDPQPVRASATSHHSLAEFAPGHLVARAA